MGPQVSGLRQASSMDTDPDQLDLQLDMSIFIIMHPTPHYYHNLHAHNIQ